MVEGNKKNKVHIKIDAKEGTYTTGAVVTLVFDDLWPVKTNVCSMNT